MFDSNFRRPRPGLEMTSLFQSEQKATVTNHWAFPQSFENASLQYAAIALFTSGHLHQVLDSMIEEWTFVRCISSNISSVPCIIMYVIFFLYNIVSGLLALCYWAHSMGP